MRRKRQPKRPWRVTGFDAVVVGTFSTEHRAITRAQHLVYTGRHPRLWIHQKMSDTWKEVP